MDDKLKVFWNLDVLVKMCRSKSDGPSLRIEEEEILDKIDMYQTEIEDIKTISEEESYDMSAEMADRNIEIITKKQLQSLKICLKEKNKELNVLKEDEKRINSGTALLRDNKTSQENYIASMQERINDVTDYEVVDRYNSLIAETTEKISYIKAELEEQDAAYKTIQSNIEKLSQEIADIEEQIDRKKRLLAETQANLEAKTFYIDKAKKDKNDKKIMELETRVQKLTKRLDEIRKDPKYYESKIKDIINNKEDIETARPYFKGLINTVINIPYINVATDNALEEELLRATQARDTFANEIEQKSYNILEAATPEKIRIEFLNERIELWNKELDELKSKVDVIDRDNEYNYEQKNHALQSMLETMKLDLREYEKAYEDIPDINVGVKASVKAALDEKRTDIVEAEKIVTAFKKDESEDIARANRTIKCECDRLNQSIKNAEQEIETITNRLTSKKSGLIDISTKNKDKDRLKELAQIVIDIKHRRQFPETPMEIIKRLEEELNIDLLNDINDEVIENTSKMVSKDYEDIESFGNTKEVKRGLKVVEETEVEIATNDEELAEQHNSAEDELLSLIDNIQANERQQASIEENEDNFDEGASGSLEQQNEEIVVDEQSTEEDEDDVDINELINSIETPLEEIEEESTEESTEESEETSGEIDIDYLIGSIDNEIDKSSVDSELKQINEETEQNEEEIVNIEDAQSEELDLDENNNPDDNEEGNAAPIIEEHISDIAIPETTLENTELTDESSDEEIPEDDSAIEQQIDDIINNIQTDDSEEQPLDKESIFENSSKESDSLDTVDNNLAIDAIFNVESDKIENTDTTSEGNLTDDFNQYIDGLENKES